MIFEDIGIIGTGLWEGEVVTNDRFPPQALENAEVKDPYHGKRDDTGTVRIAGMEFTPDKHARTIAAIEQSFRDPHRGARRRRYFPVDLKVSDAETEAASKALADAGVQAADVGAILCMSFLPDELQPKNGALIAKNLGIDSAPAWECESVCNSTITQTIIGSCLIKSGFADYVLCTQSIAFSRVMDLNVSAAVQEGDMASAFVLGPSPGTSFSSSWRTDGRLHGAIKLRWGVPANTAPRPYFAPPAERLLTHFDPFLQAQVMGEIAQNARVVCDDALGQLEMKTRDLDVFISHQPMSWFGAFMDDVLGLADGTTFRTFEEYANVNACSITASIHEARKAQRVRKGSKVLLFGPAAGYQFGAIAMNW